MVLIAFTNIVVDDFNYGKKSNLKTYIYFLTHMHSDHYEGMSNEWDFGQIYCSKVTKQLLQIKFPNKTNANGLEMNTPTEIKLSKYTPDKCQVTLLDANHCPGSVMILFQGYFGTILHTGDMRFNLEMIYNNPQLYPKENLQLRSIKVGQEQVERLLEIYGLSIHIDEMILDNTFCDPIFMFPDREEAFNMICEIIDKNKEINNNLRVLIQCEKELGKEELMVQIAKHYNTKITLYEQRFQMVQATDLKDYFTKNQNQSWIEVIQYEERIKRLLDQNTILITASGRNQVNSYLIKGERQYVIPYSLHSNFYEMQQFVSSTKPCILTKANQKSEQQQTKNSNEQIQNTYNLKQKGFQYFQEIYTNIYKLSGEYQSLLNDRERQERICKDLGIDIQVINFDEKTKTLQYTKKAMQDVNFVQQNVQGATKNIQKKRTRRRKE